MKMTLEKIKGMNIPVGAPIEITFNKNPDVDICKELGYFQGVYKKNKYGSLMYTSNLSLGGIKNTSYGNFRSIPSIKKIKILAPQK